jgi:dihydroneopterin aldolase/D-erythro-7,8-dihydroneopterin triphosphate epimerase
MRRLPELAPRPRRVRAQQRTAPVAQPARLLIRGLATRAIIGLNPDERRKRQDVRIDLALDVMTHAGRSDRVADAVDYKRVKDAVLEYVEGSRHHLLEALAEGIAGLCLRQRGVQAVEVTVDKPGALRFADSVAVSIRRTRTEARP